jgi:DNA invertase Pin-like site-specific DNA recombinase
MKNLIYCRVSSLKDESYGFAIQEYKCIEYCKSNKIRVRQIHKEYNSGFGKQKILTDIILKNKNINIIIYDISRFSRSIDFGNQLINKCIKNKITIHFVKENIIFNGEQYGSVYNTILTGLKNSENEWTQIRKRIIDSIAYRRQNGMCLGNAPFGFTSINKILTKNNNFNAIRLIVALRNGIKSSSDIQKILKTLSSEYESLQFYDENNNIIQNFTNQFTLTFKDIKDILNDYSLCDIDWTTSRVRDLYLKYCNDLEFKNDTNLANRIVTDENNIVMNMSSIYLN